MGDPGAWLGGALLVAFLLHFLYSYIRYGPEGPPQKLDADGEPVMTVGVLLDKATGVHGCVSFIALAIALVLAAVVWRAITG